jgi:hypothetical protein
MAEPEQSLTPEQQLLKAIEEPEKAQLKKKKRSGSFLKESTAAFGASWRQFFESRKDAFSVKRINVVLKRVTVGVSVLLIANLAYEARIAQRDIRSEFADLDQRPRAEIKLADKYPVSPYFFEEHIHADGKNGRCRRRGTRIRAD